MKDYYHQLEMRNKKESETMAASSSALFLAMRNGEDHIKSKQHHSAGPSSSSAAPPPPDQQQRRKRNQPGTPNPEAEVIALSPNTLMATNRFVCEVCNKGFQREQNLQLHRRGHNLPWKLKQKTTKEVKRKVYLCPEPTCVHHHPSRALGDLTGIKKHYSRKHGEKKYKCNKCAKKYAVHSDWKAHTKTCGTREYKCDCGTLFSRRDSFITHRAFCDALAQESARNPPPLGIGASQLFGSSSNSSTMSMDMSQIGSQMSAGQDHDHQNQPKADMLRLGSARSTGVTGQFDNLIGSSMGSALRPSKSMASSSYFLPESDQEDYHLENHSQHEFFSNKTLHHGLMQFSDLQNNSSASAGSSFFNLSIFPSSSNAGNLGNNSPNSTSNISSSFLFSNLCNSSHHHHASGSSNGGSTLFSDHLVRQHLSSASIPSHYSTSIQSNNISPYMSATALLQKAAQLSSTTSNSTGAFLKSFTSGASSSGTKPDPDPISSTQFGGIFGDYNTGNHIYEFMSSITGPRSSIFRPFGGAPHEHDYGYSATKLNFGEQSLRHRSPSFSNLEQASKMQQNLGVRFGGADQGLTRDFLGVGPAGELVRSMSGGGFGQREHGVEIKPLDSERKTAPESPPFGGGVNFR
nr:protein indeterminate-domain 5, chloroplastic-like [Coffea arabica]XP_027096810.1 protein indeterminate-domain 5, chloroplastic-like [Coffea arabica]